MRVSKRFFLAAFMLAPALYCWLGFVQAAMLTQNRLAAEIWLALLCVCLVAAFAIAVSAWRLSRRLSSEERANPGERR